MSGINSAVDSPASRPNAGMTLVEVVVAVAIAATAAILLYPVFIFGNSVIIANQQKLEAEGLAMDRALEVFNTFDFSGALLATNLPPIGPPPGSLLPDNTEIRTLIVPNTGTAIPFRWDVEVRVKRDRFAPGRRTVTLTNDTVYRVTRYNVGRN